MRSWKWRYGAVSSILTFSWAAIVLNSSQSKMLPLSILTQISSVRYSDPYRIQRYFRKSLVIFPLGSLVPITSKRSSASSTAPSMPVNPLITASTL